VDWLPQLLHWAQQVIAQGQALWTAITAGQSLVVLRILGGLFGLVLMLRAFRRFRRHDIKRSEFLLVIVLGLGVILVAAAPGVVTIFVQMMALQNKQFGRIIALLVLSQMLVWLLLLEQRGKSARQARQFDLLVRQLAREMFLREEAHHEIHSAVAVVVPALNEAENLRVLLPHMPHDVCGYSTSVIVVDDGSTDDTVEVARAAGALVARNPINRGGGAALRLGFDLALAARAEVIVTMDADGQHLPEELDRLVAPVASNHLDFVIGSRILGHRDRDSLVRSIGIRVFSLVINVLTGLHITDSSSGYRAFRAAALSKLLLTQDQFHTAEAIIDASKRKLRIGEVPITVRRRYSGTSKKGRNLSYGANYSKSVIKTWLRD
jgi:hypothetical protein